jgi:RHS repeat-associated protein
VAGNTIALAYDRDDLPKQMGALTIVRDAQTTLPLSTTIGNVTEVKGYNAFAEPVEQLASYGGTPLLRQQLTRDGAGRVEEILEETPGNVTTWAYSYDIDGRLWQVMKDGVLTSTYVYDDNGNRLSRTSPSGEEVGTYDGRDQVATYAGGSYEFTPSGELKRKTDPTTGAVTDFAFDGRGFLTRVSLPGGQVIDYVVDALGRRVAKKVNGTIMRRWFYGFDETMPVAEFDGSGALVARFVGRDYIVAGGRTYRVVSDRLKSPRLVIDVDDGTIAQRLEFDEFGRTLADSAPGFQPIGFAGGLYDADTGLTLFGTRDYDPVAGRWIARDPIRFGGGANSFTYCSDDPVNRVDPTGRDDSQGGLFDVLRLIEFFKFLHENRNYYNNCPPTVENLECEKGRTWAQDPDLGFLFMYGKWRASDGSECKYDTSGKLIPNYGSYNFTANNLNPFHGLIDVIPHFLDTPGPQGYGTSPPPTFAPFWGPAPFGF